MVDGCSKITVDGAPAKLIERSEFFDLALLQTSVLQEKTVAVFAQSPARLNSDITVVGYPLSGLLGGLNVTRGSVSSLKGVRGDGVQMQISAPVQPGNSGGPVVSGSGAIVSVVVSKLNARRVADETGDIPQNVNFAIRGEIAKLFLSQNGVNPKILAHENKLPPVQLAEQASAFTTFIECR